MLNFCGMFRHCRSTGPVPLNGASVKGKPLKLNSTSAVFDSGTHLIITSSADARAINEARCPSSCS